MSINSKPPLLELVPESSRPLPETEPRTDAAHDSGAPPRVSETAPAASNQNEILNGFAKESMLLPGGDSSRLSRTTSTSHLPPITQPSIDLNEKIRQIEIKTGGTTWPDGTVAAEVHVNAPLEALKEIDEALRRLGIAPKTAAEEAPAAAVAPSVAEPASSQMTPDAPTRESMIMELLKSKGLSKNGLAKKAGLHYQTVADWVSGTRDIYLGTKKKLADVLNIPVEDLP